ncbi:MAG: TIGR02678 family protein [Acidimicrobiales bacterium]
MADVDVAIAAERSVAVRTLLAAPLLVADSDAEGFALVARHRSWLVRYFDDTCGWGLDVDVPGRTARLTKRSSRPDPTRPARRARGANLPFDRRRYELLARICAELAGHGVTTIGLLASALEPAGAGGFESGLQRERAAFVDALLLLARWGVVRFEGGEVDRYVGDGAGNALVVVNSARLHRLLAPATPVSRVDAPTTAEAAAALRVEPRYGFALDDDGAGDGAGDDEARGGAGGGAGEGRAAGTGAGPAGGTPGDGWRRARHSLARRLLDDPAVHLDELDSEERAYLASPSGRRWLRERVAEAGFVLEERAEGLLAVDPDAIATDLRFPAPASTAKQVALLLVEELVPGTDGARSPRPRTLAQLAGAVGRLLAAHPTWAKDYQAGAPAAVGATPPVAAIEEPGPGAGLSSSRADGPRRLAAAAIEVLASVSLVSVDGDTVRPRAALARYAVARPEGALL